MNPTPKLRKAMRAEGEQSWHINPAPETERAGQA